MEESSMMGVYTPPDEGFCQYLVDMISGASDEEKRRRKFDKFLLPVLKKGGSFELLECDRSCENKSGFLSGVTSMFSSKSKKTAKNDMIWCELSDDLAGLTWQTLAKDKGVPLREGIIPLESVSQVSQDEKTLRMRNSAGSILMELKSGPDVDGSKWLCALKEAKDVLEPEIQASKVRKQGKVRLANRKAEMDRKKAAADAYKKSLGTTGLTYTARLMMERDNSK